MTGRPGSRHHLDGPQNNADFGMEPSETNEQRAGRSVRQRLASLRLRFDDPAQEAAFREDRFHLDLWNIRLAFLVGIGLWIGWGLLLRQYMLALSDQRLDAIIRFGVFIPLLVVGLALSYTAI